MCFKPFKKIKFKKENGASSAKKAATLKSEKNGGQKANFNRRLFNKALDFLFPLDITCNSCGRENFSGKPFCEQCEKILPRLSEGSVCSHCGRKIPYEASRCDSCSGRDTFFDIAVSVFDYAEPVNKLITALKYEGKRYISRIFAQDLCNVYNKNFLNCDFVLYVPMTALREKTRGYNQARLLAEEFSYLSGVPLEHDVVYKRRETVRQATLSFAERQKNLKASFGVKNRKRLRGKRVLLIDDVMTTGATVESVCALLKKYGASFVAVLTLASVQKRKY